MSFEGNNVLLIGGNGLLGSKIVSCVLDHDSTATIRLITRSRNTLIPQLLKIITNDCVQNRIKIYECNILNLSGLKGITDNINIIISCISSHTEAINYGQENIIKELYRSKNYKNIKRIIFSEFGFDWEKQFNKEINLVKSIKPVMNRLNFKKKIKNNPKYKKIFVKFVNLSLLLIFVQLQFLKSVLCKC